MTEGGVRFSVPVEFYETHLRTINNVKFRRREIDVVAFMINGRSGKKIASFLSLSPKTIENYTHNMMLRLECNSRESIIDFIEQSDQLQNIRTYYSILLAQDYFESKLKQIDVALSKKKQVSVALYYHPSQKRRFLLENMQRHLKILGINVFLEVLEKDQSFCDVVSKNVDKDCLIYSIPSVSGVSSISATLDQVAKNDTIQEFPQQKKTIFLSFLEENFCDEFPIKETNVDCVRFSDYLNYYLFLFDVIKKLLPDLSLEAVVEDFNKRTLALFDGSGPKGSEKALISSSQLSNVSPFLKQKKWVASSLILICLSIGMGFYFLRNENQRQSSRENLTLAIQPDLPIPVDSTFLKRPALIKQIQSKFQEEHGGIRKIALFGIGGAGKTTVARQYARQHKGVVWEINAENRDFLRESFESLAYALSTTEVDKNILMGLKDIKAIDERDRKLSFFVKERLKARPDWLLIFDNVENLNNLQNYFPSNPAAWGNGKVLVITRNSNIAAHSLIHYAVPVGELTPKEKYILFTKIINNQNDFANDQKRKVERLLRNIPSFPLDVSVMAYYLKSINIPYDEYLKRMREDIAEFDLIQANVLNEVGAYSKTRYGIIRLSLREITRQSRDFRDLLLFISVLNSQNIPIELLDRFKRPAIRDSFIHHLKKYSLIFSDQVASIPCFCIHRSTQDMTFTYLSKEFNFDKSNSLSERILNVMDSYVDRTIEREDLDRMNLSARHVESLLDHQELFLKIDIGTLKSKLGYIYYYMNDHARAQKALDEALSILNGAMNEKSLSSKVPDSLLHIGNIFTEMGDYPKAQKLFEKSLDLYISESPRNERGVAWALSCLGNVYRRQGYFEKAKNLLEESIQIHRKYNEDCLKTAHTLSYLGTVYRWLGNYERAADSFKESLQIYQRNLPESHFRIGWVYAFLGHLYSTLGEFEESKTFFEKSLAIYQVNFPKDHAKIGLMYAYLGKAHRKLKHYKESLLLLEKGRAIYGKQQKKHQERISWIAYNLGKAYEGLKDYKKARAFFDESLVIYETEHKKKGGIERAKFLKRIGEIYLFTEQLDEAESALIQSLELLEKQKHPHTYESLKALGKLYEKRSYAVRKDNRKESKAFRQRSLDCFAKALHIMKDCRLERSSDFKKIRNKIRELQINASSKPGQGSPPHLL